MKKTWLLCVLMMGFLSVMAQKTLDHFEIGPYEVDYNGKGEVKYRLKNNIDLYDFFELKKDTIVLSPETKAKVKSAIQISGYVGANRFSSKDIGIEGMWKKNLSGLIYFNGGLSFSVGINDMGKYLPVRDMFEIGIPLQIELGNLDKKQGSLYGNIGIVPAFYTTLKATKWDGHETLDVEKKSGFLLTPQVEFGANIPVGGKILRIGFYGKYKVNCAPGDYNVYKRGAGCAFLGAKLGLVL